MAQYFLSSDIDRAILKLPIKINIAADDAFKRQVEERVIKILSATEKGEFLKHFEIRLEKFRTYASSKAMDGSGISVENEEALFELPSSIAAIVAQLDKVNPEEAALLVIPILLVSAQLGAFKNSTLNRTQNTVIPTKLKEAWNQLGIQISVRENGRLVGTILVEIMRQWLIQHSTKQKLEIAA